MTQSDREAAFFVKADRAQRAAVDQLKQGMVPGRASAQHEGYVAAFTKYWFVARATPPVPVADDELLNS